MKIEITTYAQILESERPLIDLTLEEISARIETAIYLSDATLESQPDSFEATIVRETARRIIDQSVKELTYRN